MLHFKRRAERASFQPDNVDVADDTLRGWLELLRQSVKHALNGPDLLSFVFASAVAHWSPNTQAHPSPKVQ